MGNESSGCGGKFTPEDYCKEYRRFVEWVPGFGLKPYVIVAGPRGNDVEWTRRFFKKWSDYERAPLHGWAPHYYCGSTGHALEFSDDQWYQMLHKGNQMEKLIRDQWTALGEFDREHKVKLIIDEWGAWHPAGTEINKRHQFEQMGCLRDAVVAALTLDTFNRHAEKIDMGNVAQLANCLHSLFLADGDRFVATPSFYVFEMYKPHHNAQAVRTLVGAPDVTFEVGDRKERIFRVAGSVSRVQGKVTLTLVHSHVSEPAEVAIRLHAAKENEVRQTVLTHKKLNAHNTFDHPREVVSKSSQLDLSGSRLCLVLAPASINRLDIWLG